MVIPILRIYVCCNEDWKSMKERIVIICIGYLLDRIIGDPHRLWHPVQGIGKLIQWMENGLFWLFSISDKREEDKIKKRIAGGLLVVLVLGMVMGTTIVFLLVLYRICPQLKFVWECIICYQMLAMKSLKSESMRVYDALTGRCVEKNNMEEASSDDKKTVSSKEACLEAGRQAVSRIVGRDTCRLSEEGVIKATIETIAENTSDGVIAPLFYMCIFGPLGGVFYKAVNTMDSMIGYRNDRYLYFGTAAARLDDILNFMPSRISALLMIIACEITGLDGKNAWKIFKRDRYKHASPNSAQTESACAGALNIELGGPAYYFGELHDKLRIGDANREIKVEDIIRANNLLYASANVMFVLYVVISMTIYLKG